MIATFLNIWRPEVYHGLNKQGPFFEGWYFKLVNKEQNRSYAIIPAVYLSKNPEESFSFIQMLDGQNHQVIYQNFSLDQFWSDKNLFLIKIGDNQFAINSITLDINSGGKKIKGTIYFEDINPWPIKLFSPGAMGWYAFMPFMQCYHGALSFDHQLKGDLFINDKRITFDGGAGYIEKDWGRAFPSAYVWTQCNHFEKPGISIMVSIAKIPWLKSWFRGFLAGLLYKNELYPFTTYTGAKLDFLHIHEKKVNLAIFDKKYRLEIEVEKNRGGLLYGPDGNKFVQNIYETLNSTLNLRFLRRNKYGDEILFEGVGSSAALDVNGKLEEIVD